MNKISHEFWMSGLPYNPDTLLYLYDKHGEPMQSYCDEPLTVCNTTPVISSKGYGFPEMWVNNKVCNVLLISKGGERNMVYVGD